MTAAVVIGSCPLSILESLCGAFESDVPVIMKFATIAPLSSSAALYSRYTLYFFSG